MFDPFSAGLFASVGSAFKFADVAVRIAEAGSENAVFVRVIHVVRSDLEEVERLLSLESVQKKLTGTPGKTLWIKAALQNTKYALNDFGKWVERARVEHEATGSIKFETRVRWVFNDHEKLLNRKTELLTCHQQLSNVLGYLTCLEDVSANLVPLRSESAIDFDDILSRHTRTSAPKAPKAILGGRTSTQQEGVVAEQTPDALTRSIPIPGTWNLPTVQTTGTSDRYNAEFLSNPPLQISPPGSPPPTYAAIVSIGSALYTLPEPHSHIPTHHSVPVHETLDQKTLSLSENDRSAYRIGLGDMTIPELTADTVSFSATNSAGPVNPYELCGDSSGKDPAAHCAVQEPSEVLAEMLGDLYFPLELPSNESVPTQDSPPWPRDRPEYAGLTRSNHTRLSKRNTSKIRPIVHRRPVPTTALSDSLLTVHGIPPSLEMNAGSGVMTETEAAVHSSESGSFDMNLLSLNTQQSEPYNGSFSHIVRDSYSRTASCPLSIAHYSKPPTMQSVFSQQAAAFTADSTSTWGLDTQPKASKTPTVSEPAATTRMQSQKQILELLRRIDT